MSGIRQTIGAAALVAAVLCPICPGADDPAVSERVWAHPRTIRVAAVQMEAELGEVERNLERS